MNKAPNIGDRVRFAGNGVVGPCVGTVTRIFKEHRYPDDFDWDSDENPRSIGFKSEREWHVAMKPDRRPSPWAYGDSDTFAPEVADIEPEPRP